ncbi:MAG: hypothetical protein GY769_07790 [bacterium]|nr:hypothetical protein [bacterium]
MRAKTGLHEGAAPKEGADRVETFVEEMEQGEWTLGEELAGVPELRARIRQLLEANTAEVERRRKAEAELERATESHLLNAESFLDTIRALRRGKENCRLRFFLAGAVAGLLARYLLYALF